MEQKYLHLMILQISDLDLYCDLLFKVYIINMVHCDVMMQCHCFIMVTVYYHCLEHDVNES